MWAFAVCDIDSLELTFGNSIESFADYISEFPSQCYFHNLAFDGSFILDWLLRQGFYCVTEDKKLYPGEFSTLISNDGKFYSIKVRWLNGDRTEFRDSFKKLPMSVKAVAKAWKLEEQKGELDYDEYRAPGHVLTDVEKSYIANDVVIVAKALKQQFDAGMSKLTVGADSLSMYKHMYPQFDETFPVLNMEVDSNIRRAYRGGFTYASPRFAKRVTRGGRVYDVNSLYPSVMYNRILPFGEPVWRPGPYKYDPNYPLAIMGLVFSADIKPNHIPCIQIKGNSYFMPSEYQDHIDCLEMYASNVDIDLWRNQYDMDVHEWLGGWYFHATKGMFREYIDYWMNIKMNSTGGLRQIAKLHLNSLYGKFATNPDVTGKFPVLDKNVLSLRLGPEETRDPVYTALGVFITSWARDVTIRAAQEHYATFAYADTDSLHLLVDEDPADLDIDPVRLGAWKHESTFDSAFFGRAKCYTEHVGGCTCNSYPHEKGCGYTTHIAGLSAEHASHVEFGDMYDGHKFPKLSPKRVPGGIVLTDVGFTLNL